MCSRVTGNMELQMLLRATKRKDLSLAPTTILVTHLDQSTLEVLDRSWEMRGQGYQGSGEHSQGTVVVDSAHKA